MKQLLFITRGLLHPLKNMMIKSKFISIRNNFDSYICYLHVFQFKNELVNVSKFGRRFFFNRPRYSFFLSFKVFNTKLNINVCKVLQPYEQFLAMFKIIQNDMGDLKSHIQNAVRAKNYQRYAEKRQLDNWDGSQFAVRLCLLRARHSPSLLPRTSAYV